MMTEEPVQYCINPTVNRIDDDSQMVTDKVSIDGHSANCADSMFISSQSYSNQQYGGRPDENGSARCFPVSPNSLGSPTYSSSYSSSEESDFGGFNHSSADHRSYYQDARVNQDNRYQHSQGASLLSPVSCSSVGSVFISPNSPNDAHLSLGMNLSSLVTCAGKRHVELVDVNNNIGAAIVQPDQLSVPPLPKKNFSNNFAAKRTRSTKTVKGKSTVRGRKAPTIHALPGHRPHSTPTTLIWLQCNYENADAVCIPRSTLYRHYSDFCTRHKITPVNAASFGKVRFVARFVCLYVCGWLTSIPLVFVLQRSDHSTAVSVLDHSSTGHSGPIQVRQPQPALSSSILTVSHNLITLRTIESIFCSLKATYIRLICIRSYFRFGLFSTTISCTTA